MSVTVTEFTELFFDDAVLIDELATVNVQIAAAVATYERFGRMSHEFPMNVVLSVSQVDTLQSLIKDYRSEGGQLKLKFFNQPNVTEL